MHSSEKILIVDDDVMLRWTLTEALREWGYDSIEADSTSAGLELFEQVDPKAVLLDIGLPDGSGLELLRAIKQRRPHTPVIMMTGEVVVENTIGALRGGADDFVGKPVHLDELQFALKRALQRRHRELNSGLPRLLIVTDSQAWANHLVTALRTTDVEVTVTTTPEELRQAVEEEHDIAIVDVEALELRNVLAALRASPAHTEIPILVEISHLAANANISGVLPQYRAMPCNTTDLISLARRRLAAMIARPTSYEVAGLRPLL